jgi:hypothetical protein
MRPKFWKQSALKLAGRIIPRSGGHDTTQFAAKIVSKACFGVHAHDFLCFEKLYRLQEFSSDFLSGEERAL